MGMGHRDTAWGQCPCMGLVPCWVVGANPGPGHLLPSSHHLLSWGSKVLSQNTSFSFPLYCYPGWCKVKVGRSKGNHISPELFHIILHLC